MKLDTKQIRQRRFQRALLDLGCSATELASKYGLPYRSVARWLAGSASPGPQRLKKLCPNFNWNYEAMFLREGLEDEALETQQLGLLMLNRRYLSVRPRDPVAAWSYVSLAAAIVFNHFSKNRLDCQAVINHHFGSRIEFLAPALAKISLQVSINFGRGLIIRWLEERQSKAEWIELSDSTL